MQKCVALVLISVIAPCLSYGQILHSGFEEKNMNAKLSVNHWDTYDQPVTSRLDSMHSHSGHYSMRVKGGKGMKSVAQRVSYDSKGFQQLLLRAFIKTDSLHGRAGLLAIITNTRGQMTYSHGSEGIEITKNGDWTKFEIPIITEPGVNQILVGGAVYGQGIAWFDDFELSVPDQKQETIPRPKVVEDYVNEFTTIIKDNALNFGQIDQQKFNLALAELTHSATTKEDCYPAFRYAIKMLNDNHSQFFAPKYARNWSAEAGAQRIDFAEGRMVEGKAYLKVPGFKGGNEKDQRLFADSLQRLIARLDINQPSGWIVDLRENNGGNCWPVLAGLGPLVEGEECGYFFVKGAYSGPWNYSHGASRIGQEKQCSVTTPYTLTHRNLKTVILQSSRTLSSGEVIAVAFKGRPNTVLMGTNSGGLTSSNAMFRLSDGAVVNLTTSIYADRNKKHYLSGVDPDIKLQPGDDALKRALDWIGAN